MNRNGSDGTSVQRIYFLLAAFNVGTLLAGLWLSKELMTNYRDSVGENEVWAKRLALYARTGQYVTRADGPGNDVFVNSDVAGESENYLAIRKEAKSLFSEARKDLGSDFPQLTNSLIAAEEAFDEQCRETELVFETFATNREVAGEHMGRMDQAFSKSSGALDELRNKVQDIQSQHFAHELEVAQSREVWQYGLLALVLIMVVAVVTYGFRLQKTFARKQAEIDRANADMRLVLDNVNQGLLTLDATGAVTGQQSQCVRTWLGDTQSGVSFLSVLERFDGRAAAWFRSGWEMIVEDLMPLEVVLDQLPRRFAAGRRELELSWRPILTGSKLQSLLLMIDDVTARVEGERTERLQKQQLALFERVLRDREMFLESFDECARLLASLGEGDEATQKRAIHTLKGSSSSIGMSDFSGRCHQLEDRIEESGALMPEDREELVAAWADVKSQLDAMMPKGGHGVSLGDDEYEAMLAAVSGDGDTALLKPMVESLRMEPMSRRFEQLSDQARNLAAQLGKGLIYVRSDAGGVRFDRTRWSPFLNSLVHVVRNAVDHGLESQAERAEAKKAPATIRFDARLSDSAQGPLLVVSIADDGRGIDFGQLMAKARAQGYTASDPVGALFVDGASTANEVTTLSGRGVGMSAVKAEVERLGGTIDVSSRAGVGTTFTFCFPAKGISALGRSKALVQSSASRIVRLARAS